VEEVEPISERKEEVQKPMKLTIIPVAHISAQSAQLVEETIVREDPDLIGLELCRERLASLSKGARRGMDIRTAISHPTSAFLFLAQQALGKFWKINPGLEMVAALKAASVIGKPVALLDRPIRLTAREIEKIPLREKLGILLWDGGIKNRKGIKIRDLMDEGVLAPLLSGMREKFPLSYKVLVESRNKYMLARLLAQNPAKAVLVVGAAHAGGIRELALKAEKPVKVEIVRY
jgi:pheromone shutdown protein TraB